MILRKFFLRSGRLIMAKIVSAWFAMLEFELWKKPWFASRSFFIYIFHGMGLCFYQPGLGEFFRQISRPL